MPRSISLPHDSQYWIPLMASNIFNKMVISQSNLTFMRELFPPTNCCSHFSMLSMCAFILFTCLYLLREGARWQIEFKLKLLFIGRRGRFERLPSAWHFPGLKKGSCLFSFHFSLLSFARFLSDLWVFKVFLLCFIYSFQITWSNLRAINIDMRYNLIVKGGPPCNAERRALETTKKGLTAKLLMLDSFSMPTSIESFNLNLSSGSAMCIEMRSTTFSSYPRRA